LKFPLTLLLSIYEEEEFPLFGKEGSGEIFTTICPFDYGLLSKYVRIYNGCNTPATGPFQIIFLNH